MRNNVILYNTQSGINSNHSMGVYNKTSGQIFVENSLEMNQTLQNESLDMGEDSVAVN